MDESPQGEIDKSDALPSGRAREIAPSPTIDHYQSIVDRAHKEIEGVRSIYKWLAGSLAVIMAVGVATASYITYKTFGDMKADMRSEIELIKGRMSQEMEMLAKRLTFDLEAKIRSVEREISNRIDEEFDKERIHGLVERKARERIDSIADTLIKQEIQQAVTPRIRQLEQRLAVFDENLLRGNRQLQENQRLVEEVKALSDILYFVIRAQVDDRRAYDKIKELTRSNTKQLADLAGSVILAINKKYTDTPFYLDQGRSLQIEGKPASEASVAVVVSAFKSENTIYRKGAMDALAQMKDKKAVPFIIGHLRSESSLQVVAAGIRALSHITGQESEPLDYDYWLSWWKQKKGEF